MKLLSRFLGGPAGPAGASKQSGPGIKRPLPSSLGESCVPVPARPALQAEALSDDDDDEDDGVLIIRPSLNSASLCRRRTALDGLRSRSSAASTFSGSDDGTSCSGPLSELVGAVSMEALCRDVTLFHRGRHAAIFRARERRTGRSIVLKGFPKARMTPRLREAAEREARMLALAAGPGVVRRRRMAAGSAALEEDAEYLYLPMEAATGGTLIEHVANQGGKLSEFAAATSVAVPLLATLSRLHALGMVHRDIKPEHLLLSSGSQGVLLTDFGTAAAPKHERGELLNHRCGSIEYCAPEMLSKPTAAEVFHLVLSQGMSEDELPTYDHKVDIWATGVLLFEVLTGFQPFLADTSEDMVGVIAARLAQSSPTHEGVPDFLARHGLSNDCTDFLKAALCYDPARRPDAAQLLQHAWLRRWLRSGVVESMAGGTDFGGVTGRVSLDLKGADSKCSPADDDTVLLASDSPTTQPLRRSVTLDEDCAPKGLSFANALRTRSNTGRIDVLRHHAAPPAGSTAASGAPTAAVFGSVPQAAAV